MFRIALAQVNPTVGDFENSARIISEFTGTARESGADLVVFPELALSGYPPEDLLFKDHFLEDSRLWLERLLPELTGITAVVGCPLADNGIRNAAVVVCDGKITCCYYKQHLPNYGVFDEKRYFKPGSQSPVLQAGGIEFGVSICEDIWVEDGPADEQAKCGAELLVNISASPYHMGKTAERTDVLSGKAKRTGAFIAYCNLVGGQDELVFDGGSMVFSPAGTLIARSKQFSRDLLLVDIPLEKKAVPGIDTTNMITPDSPFSEKEKPIKPRIEPAPGVEEEVYKALTLGLRDYMRKNGFQRAILGLSGGIDSSLTAAIACDALGPENVTGVSMPSTVSSRESVADARELAENLGMELLEIPISGIMDSYLTELGPIFINLPIDVTEENLQARIRGNLLMGISNKLGWLVLSTGNKSETSVGYCTLYGDMAGGLALIKDVPKTVVYRLAVYRNGLDTIQVIPDAILKKEPTAELSPGQKDTDNLPPYDLLDPVLNLYIEEDMSTKEIARMGFDEAMVSSIATLVDRNEYKRRQAPPGIKITPRAFGKDRRMPITNRFKQQLP
ncbi:MAG: NAD+ synthase [Actinobacteria bacterium]|nr:NAD+ synthase [Actinomycetota bacterium]